MGLWCAIWVCVGSWRGCKFTEPNVTDSCFVFELRCFFWWLDGWIACVCLPLCMYVSIDLCPSIYLSMYVCKYSLSLSIESIYVCIPLSIYLFLSIYFYLSIYESIYLSVFLFEIFCLNCFITLCVFVNLQLCICVSMHLSVYVLSENL